MFPEIRILNIFIPLYPVCVSTGFLIGTLAAMNLGKKIGYSENQTFHLWCWIESGVIIGGKIMFLLINSKNLSRIFRTFGIVGVVTRTGYVFYGGLIGGFIAVFLFSQKNRYSFVNNLSFALLVTPLIHSFGRIGCFCAGCCYGKEWNGNYAVFIHGAERFPVQIVEAGADLLLFLLLLIFFLHDITKKKLIISIYLIGYGLIRCFSEFFRGDISRGYIGVMSISSWISILIIFIGLFSIKFLNKRTDNERDKNQ